MGFSPFGEGEAVGQEGPSGGCTTHVTTRVEHILNKINLGGVEHSVFNSLR
jgi:hypothetical protein